MTKKIVKTKSSGKKLAGSKGLPKDVTEEPRSPEEMHLGLIKDKPTLVKAYLAPGAPTTVATATQEEWLSGLKGLTPVIGIMSKFANEMCLSSTKNILEG